MKTALLLSLLALAVAEENNDCVGKHCKGAGYGYGEGFDDAGKAVTRGHREYSGSFGHGPGVVVTGPRFGVAGGIGFKGGLEITRPAMKPAVGIPGFAFRRVVMPGYGMSGYGMPGYRMSGHGMPGYGMSGYGMSGYRMSGHGMPGYGMAGHVLSGYGTSEYGTSGYGMSGYGVSGYGASGARLPVYGGYGDDVRSVDYNGPNAVSGARVGFGGGFGVGASRFRPVFQGYPSFPNAVGTMAGYDRSYNRQVYNVGFPGVGVSVGAIRSRRPQYGTGAGISVATLENGSSVGTAGVGLERSIDDRRRGTEFVSGSYSNYPKAMNNGLINAGGSYPVPISASPGRQCTCKSQCGWGEMFAGGCPGCKNCKLIQCCKIERKY